MRGPDSPGRPSPGSYALDASVIVEVLAGSRAAAGLTRLMAAGEVVAYAARLSLSEALYVACRLWGRETAYSRMRILLDSGALTIVEDDEVWEYAADCKCRLPISLGDCYTLATAKRYRVRPLFLKPEREITGNEARLREWLGPGLEPVYLTG